MPNYRMDAETINPQYKNSENFLRTDQPTDDLYKTIENTLSLSPPDNVVSAVYTTSKIEMPIELKKIELLSLKRANQKNQKRRFNSVNERVTDLSKNEIEELASAGASIEDVYWINLIVKELQITPSNLLEIKKNEFEKWEEIKYEISNNDFDLPESVKDTVYQSEFNKDLSLIRPLTVSNDVYNVQSLEGKLNMVLGTNGISSFASNVNNVFYGLATQQQINQTKKQQYSDRSASSELIDPTSGALTWKENEISLPGKDGLDLNIGIMYNSNQSFSYMRDYESNGQIKKYNYLISRYDLGMGWSFQFPSVQLEGGYIYYHNGQGAVYRVDFNGGDSLSSYTHLVGYQGKDIQFLQDDGSYSNGLVSSSYYLQYSDKKREYFASDGRLIGIVDRFGNAIKFEHIDRMTYDGQTNKVISVITDTLGRKVKFDYESNLNTIEPFYGENIVLSTINTDGTEAQKVTLTKSRSSNTFNGNPDGYSPALWRIKDQIGQVTTFDYDTTTFAKFQYDQKNVSSYSGYNSYARLVGINYPISITKYQYELVTRNLGAYGFGEEFRIKSRSDVVKNTYNQVNYTYSGDYTGYPAHSDPNLLPEYYKFSSTSTIQSQSATNGLSTTTQFNGLMQDVSTISQAQNGERKEMRNSAFHPVFKYLPIKTSSADFAVGDDENTANTLYSDITYTDWGAVESQTQPLTQSQIGNSNTKNKYTTTFTYEPNYHLINTKSWYQNDSTQLTENYEYYENGRIKSYTNPNNEITTYSYEGIPGDTAKIISATEETFTGNGLKTRTTTVYSSDSNYAYPTNIIQNFTNISASGQKTPVTIEKSMKYDMGTGLLKEETIDGKTTKYTYDLIGRVIGIVYPTVTNQNGKKYEIEDQFEYTTGIFSSSLFDPENQSVSMLRVNSKRKYNLQSNWGTTYLSNENEYYDGLGLLRLKEVIDTGAKTQYHIDDMSRAIYVRDPVGVDTSVKYDAWGQQNEVIDTDGNLYINEHILKLRKETNYMVEASKVAAYRQTNDAQFKSSYIEQNYDQWGHLLSNVTFKEWPVQSESSKISELYSYDFAGNIITYTDPNNNQNNEGVTTSYSYDKLNRLKSVKDSLNQITSYQYDRSGQISNTTMKDSLNGTEVTLSSKDYNEMGLLYNKSDSESFKENQTFNQSGLLSQKIDRNGTVFNYHYDERNQIVNSLLSGADGKTQQNKVIFGSDGILNDTFELYQDGVNTASQTATIDTSKRVTALSSKATTANYSASTSYIFDSINRTTRLAGNQSGLSSFYVNYQYTKKRLEKVQTNGLPYATDSATANVSYEYFPSGKVKSIIYPTLADGKIIKSEFDYNSLNQLRTLTNYKGSSVISSYTYLYDNNGNITTASEVLLNGGSKTTTYEYDKLNRIKSITPSYGGETIIYEYDLRGNRNLVSGYSPDQLKTANLSYSYDLQNTLTGVTKNNSSTLINYLPNGLRYQKTSGTLKTQYNYNGNAEVISETKSNGEKAVYVRGDRLLIKKDVTSSSTKDYYYLYNGHGDVVQIVDTNGQVVNSYSYDVWGNITNQEERIPNSFKYAGEIYDEETGLYYLRARYYDPSIGRFINEDTDEGQINNPLSQNLYIYVDNNPLIYNDPSGHRKDAVGPSGGSGGGVLLPPIVTGAVIKKLVDGLTKGFAIAASSIEINKAIKNKKKKEDQVILYHATDAGYVDSILKAVSVKAGRESTDFGQGFYLTNDPKQAEIWAQRFSQGVVMAFAVDEDLFKEYNGKNFSTAFSPGVTGLTDFVYMNRNQLGTHTYDYVTGPMLGNPVTRIGTNDRGRPIKINTPPENYKFWGNQISIHNQQLASRIVQGYIGSRYYGK